MAGRKRMRDTPYNALATVLNGQRREFDANDARAVNHAACVNMISEITELQERSTALGMIITGHTLNCAKAMLVHEISKDISYQPSDRDNKS